MKKTLLKIGAIIACTAVFTYSCQDDLMVMEDQEAIVESFTVEEARSWFETNGVPISRINGANAQNTKSTEAFKRPESQIIQAD